MRDQEPSSELSFESLEKSPTPIPLVESLTEPEKKIIETLRGLLKVIGNRYNVALRGFTDDPYLDHPREVVAQKKLIPEFVQLLQDARSMLSGNASPALAREMAEVIYTTTVFQIFQANQAVSDAFAQFLSDGAEINPPARVPDKGHDSWDILNPTWLQVSKRVHIQSFKSVGFSRNWPKHSA